MSVLTVVPVTTGRQTRYGMRQPGVGRKPTLAHSGPCTRLVARKGEAKGDLDTIGLNGLATPPERATVDTANGRSTAARAGTASGERMREGAEAETPSRNPYPVSVSGTFGCS